MDVVKPALRGAITFWGLATGVFLALMPPVTLADDVSQVTGPPPALYKKIAKLLTSAGEVLKKQSEYSH